MIGIEIWERTQRPNPSWMVSGQFRSFITCPDCASNKNGYDGPVVTPPLPKPGPSPGWQYPPNSSDVSSLPPSPPPPLSALSQGNIGGGNDGGDMGAGIGLPPPPIQPPPPPPSSSESEDPANIPPPPSGGPGGLGVLYVTYSWFGTGQRNLNTATKFLSATVGHACGISSQYLYWSGDNTGVDGSESASILVDKAYDDWLWTSSTNIYLYAAWNPVDGGSGPAKVTVKYNGVTRTKDINPVPQAGCVSSYVAHVIVVHNDDGNTFELY